MDHLKLVELYDNGSITGMEFSHSFLCLVTEENVTRLMASLNQELHDFVVLRAEKFDGVDLVRTFRIEAVVFTEGYDKEAHQKRMAEESQKFLKGTAIVREYAKLRR
jgi:hypothetical protein